MMLTPFDAGWAFFDLSGGDKSPPTPRLITTHPPPHQNNNPNHHNTKNPLDFIKSKGFLTLSYHFIYLNTDLGSAQVPNRKRLNGSLPTRQACAHRML